jgi:tetratricopeptide (TPR) repeat protein
MPIRKEELALFSLSLLKKFDKPGVRFTKDQVAMAMDISPKTLDLYMTNLKRKKMIERNKKKYVNDFRETYNITDIGNQDKLRIEENINNDYLTPENHNIPSIVPITRILNRIEDPLEKIFFLTLYTMVKSFDLPMYLETIKTAKQDSTMVNALSVITESKDEVNFPLIETFFRSCFYGDIDIEELEHGSCYGENLNTLLIVAEASYKKGKYNDALAIYDHILASSEKINQGQWFIARIGKALVLSKKGDIEKSLELLDKTYDLINNPIYQAYTWQMKARILSTTDNKIESKELFDKCIRSFHSSGVPLLLAIAYNNRGILHYRNGNIQYAEEDWNKSRKYVTESKSTYSEACLLPNLASIMIHKGDLIKAEKYLKRSKEIFSDLGDYEGVAIADLNYSFLFLEKEDFKKALEFFRDSENLAFPSPSQEERKERRDAFVERAKEKGFKEALSKIQGPT